MKLKVKGDCNIDIALKREEKEYLFSINLCRWSFFEKKTTEAGYKSIRILCFVFATLDRKVFDHWVEEQFGDMLKFDPEPTKSTREDVM